LESRFNPVVVVPGALDDVAGEWLAGLWVHELHSFAIEEIGLDRAAR